MIPTLSERSRLQRRKSLGQLQTIESLGPTSELPVGIALYFEAMAAAEAAAEAERRAEEAARLAAAQAEAELLAQQLKLEAALRLAVEEKKPRPFDQALTAIEANPWLECGIWLIAISIDALSALHSVLKEYQPRHRAKAALLRWSNELGRLTWPRTLKQWCLETSHRLLAA